MAEDLGEVRVRIQQEGAEEAANTIGDAVGQGAEDAGTGQQGAGAGSGIGGMLGGISTKLAGILGFVAFLASLKPIQELLTGLQRLFTVAILPLVALLTTFLRPILQKLLRFVGSLDFNNLAESLLRNLTPILDRLPQIISKGLKETSQSALNFSKSQALSDFIFQFNTLQDEVASGEARRGPLGSAVRKGSLQEDLFIQLGWLDEQSNTSMSSNVASTNAEVVQKQGTGGQ